MITTVQYNTPISLPSLQTRITLKRTQGPIKKRQSRHTGNNRYKTHKLMKDIQNHYTENMSNWDPIKKQGGGGNNTKCTCTVSHPRNCDLYNMYLIQEIT